MSYDEAHCIAEPQKVKLRKRKEKSYFPVVCILFIITLALCTNNLIIYKSYRNIQKDFEFAYHEMTTIQQLKSNILTDNENLKNENKALLDKYNVLSAQNQEILKAMAEIKQRNEELEKSNKELADDNVALQNSLKKAASVGIKPQNFTSFNGIISRGEVDKGKYLGKFLGTAYTPSKEECGNNKGITNSGHPIIPGISVAIDNSYWPFGTVFYIKGLGYAVAMDTGTAIKGKNRFDFAVFDKKFAQTLGTKYWDVYLVKLGNGRVSSINF